MNVPRYGQRARTAALALALLWLAAGCAAVEQPQPPDAKQEQTDSASKEPDAKAIKPLPGYRAANFHATDVFTGEKVTLADLKGEVVFLNFWATWCPPCKAEMPEMEALHQEMGDKVRIIALGADAREPADKMAGFAKEMGLTFTVAHDGGIAVEAYTVQGIPTSFFIDREGVILARHTGPLTLEQMKAYIAEAEKRAAAKQ